MVALAPWAPRGAYGRPHGAAGCGALHRLGLPGLWGLIGYLHCYGASTPVLVAAIALAAGLGAAIVRVAEDDTQWSGLLAAAMLLTSPLLQPYWTMAQEGPHWARLMVLRTAVIMGGLLLLARLGAERPQHAD